jgi:D-alanyl-D-alanine carboxypeptidase/D-alanyl-D-alanine-endopeptidase (penicillin-binding protein 4)
LGGGGGDKTHLAETPASEIGRNFSPRITDPGSIRALAPGTCIPRFSAILSLAILAANPAQAQTPPAATPSLATQISALISAPEVSRDHWGILVTTLDGTPIYALNEAQLFQPDSNAKLFTTAAALALLGPDKTFETTVAGSLDARSGTVEGDLVLTGGGDANLSARELPYASHPQLSKVSSPPPDPLRYLEEMADQVAAKGVKLVTGNVVGDDTGFVWESYPEGWAIDDAVWGYGAPVSALSIADNQLRLTVTASPIAGQPNSAATVTLDQNGVPYYTVESHVIVARAKSPTDIQVERAPGSRNIRVYGQIAENAAPDSEEIAIADPADYAAMAFKQMLEARGITVRGTAHARHRPQFDPLPFLTALHASRPCEEVDAAITCSDNCYIDAVPLPALATHRSAPLAEDVVATLKESLNLHAELLLRDLGGVSGCNSSSVAGARLVRSFLIKRPGLDPNDFLFYDGSGLSSHDLVTPRAIAKLLSYAAHDPKTGAPQPWFADWKASLPIGGVDGTLDSRFTKPPLKGHVFAKTGTHSEGRALSGYLDCASGRTVIFSILVNNHLPGSNVDRDAMDQIVAAIAAAE